MPANRKACTLLNEPAMNHLHREVSFLSMCALVSVSCTGDISSASPAPSSGPGADRAHVTSTVQAIVNGMPLGLPDDQHGIVSLWQFQAVTKAGVEIDEWRQACTATLLTNTLALTAHHCFTSPLIDSSSVWGSLNGEFIHFASRTSAPNLDAELLTADTPFELNGSTTGYNRVLMDGADGQAAMAGGYGYSMSPQGRPNPSAICGSGYVGCPEDPAPLLISSHTTFWDAAEHNHELGIATNEKGQIVAAGDSGSGLFFELYAPFLDWPLLGVASSEFPVDPDNNPGLWHAQYVPIQELRGWLCDNGYGC
jgi:hypothetical protein